MKQACCLFIMHIHQHTFYWHEIGALYVLLYDYLFLPPVLLEWTLLIEYYFYFVFVAFCSFSVAVSIGLGCCSISSDAFAAMIVPNMSRSLESIVLYCF